ncbi:cytochrome P450 [Artemisia annua]|uniref:Cytochrome P450 n=1 Tax=Artemisia annua TaxID=35608 RepID=A0A2U1M3V6_ARTAN|nr:cytochrome P450 [Artemisia annua]
MGLPIIGEMFTFLWYFKVLCRPDDYINSKRHTDCISSTATKYVFRSEESFLLEWPNAEIVGKSSLVAVHGKTHARLRSFVSINQPDALRQIAHLVQPRMVSALQCWAKFGKINSCEEIKKCQKKPNAIFKEELDKRKNNIDYGSTQPMKTLWMGMKSFDKKTYGVCFFSAYSPFLVLLSELRAPIRVLPLQSIAGFTIPKGWNVMIWIRYLHTDPKNFNDPLCFNPHRWDVPMVPADPKNFNDPLCFNPDRWDVPMVPGTYQVFGGGSRICAGNMLARLQLAFFIICPLDTSM